MFWVRRQELELVGGYNESGAEGVHLLELKDTGGCNVIDMLCFALLRCF